MFSTWAFSAAVMVRLSTMSMHDPLSMIHFRADFPLSTGSIAPPVDQRALLKHRSPRARWLPLTTQGSPLASVPTSRDKAFARS